MIIYINTFVTDKRLVPFFRGKLPQDNRLDIFKYSLASFAAIEGYSRVVINAKLDENYLPRQKELESWIDEIFQGKAIYSPERVQYQKEWQRDIDEKINDSIIWYCCNDDHIFIEENRNTIDLAEKAIKEDPHPYKSFFFSHFPELLMKAMERNAKKKNGLLCFDWQDNSSIQMVSLELLRAIWFDYDYKDHAMTRPDFYHQAQVPPAHFFVGCKETCRHLDAYSHVGIDANLCPPLTVPPGFFDKNIKIRYGYPDNIPGWVNINLDKHNYTVVDENGTDYKWCLDKLPKAWKGRISEIDKNPGYDTNGDLEKHRNAAHALATSYGFKRRGWLDD